MESNKTRDSARTGPKMHRINRALSVFTQPRPIPDIRKYIRALVVAPVVGSVVLMFVTAGFAAMAIGAFSKFMGYRIRRQDGRRGAR